MTTHCRAVIANIIPATNFIISDPTKHGLL